MKSVTCNTPSSLAVSLCAGIVCKQKLYFQMKPNANVYVCLINSPTKCAHTIKTESSELNTALKLIEMGSGGKIPVNFPSQKLLMTFHPWLLYA